MSWFSSAVSIDDQVQRATSESLPTGQQDLALNLEICDLIRSKTVPPKDAMRSLKRRLLNKNPNVQIATLHLVDVCIKNGGFHFLVEVASREFVDAVVLLIKPVGSAKPNPDVEKLTLESIQNWTNSFAGQIQLSYVGTVYQKLKDEGYQFPAYAPKINSSFIDSSVPPEWVDSDTCMESGTAFSFVNRKHHCRNCGGVFIQKHCNNYVPLPHFGINAPVRVCDGCYAKLKVGGGGSKNKDNLAATTPYTSSVPDIGEEMDEDLKRALELSLAESKGFSASYTAPTPPPVTASATDADDDEELKAAIAASLRDMQGSSAPAPAESASSHPTVQSLPPVKPNWELTQTEEDNIAMYATLVEKVKGAPPGTILREGQIQELNENISSLRPKLARTLAETVSKYDTLVDMNAKLTTAIRFYDSLLEERLLYAYNRHNIADPVNSGYPPQPHYQMPLQSQLSGPTPLSPQHTYNNQFQPSPSTALYAPSAPPANQAPSAPSYEFNPSAPPSAQQPAYYQQHPQQPAQQPAMHSAPTSREPPKEEHVLIEL